MLRDPPRENGLITRLDFDFSMGFPKKIIYQETAAFLGSGDVLKVQKTVFFRYLCSPEHGNIGIKFNGLERAINHKLSE